MSKYNWNYPTTIWVGQNRINNLVDACNQLSIKKPLFVTDQGLVKTKMVTQILDNLKKKQIEVYVYSKVVGNPVGSNVTEGVQQFLQNKNDGVIAFGGGSGLDVGKAIAFMSGQNLPIWDFEDVGDNLFNPDPYYQQGGDMVRVGGMGYQFDVGQTIGSRISNMTLLETGEKIEPTKTYIVGGWASINEATKGPAIYDVVSNYVNRKKSITIKENTDIKIKGM